MRREHLHRLRHRPLELRIVTRDHILRPILHVDVRRRSNVLNRPAAFLVEEAAARRDHRPAVHERWCVPRADQATPRPLPNERADLPVLEHVGHQVAARSRHLVHDHHLRAPDSGRRARERIPVADGIVEVSIEVASEDIDDIIRG